jgi:RNA polymerase sigma-70 factor (ECF subfamily)
MRHLDELSNPEIAAIMSVSIEAVESLLARGRRQLKTCLEAEISALGYRDEKI